MSYSVGTLDIVLSLYLVNDFSVNINKSNNYVGSLVAE